MFLFILIIKLFIISNLFSYNINITIMRSDTREIINDSIVIIVSNKDTHETTFIEGDIDGKYKIENIKSGKYIIEIKSLNYYSEKFSVDIDKNKNFQFYLTPLLTSSFKEINVIGKKNNTVLSKNIIPKNWNEKSTTSLHGDALYALKKMPSVNSEDTIDLTGPSVGVSRFSVRGGNYFENSTVLDGLFIKYPFHNLEWDSVFIDELVDNIVIYKGVVPSEYGQVLSSLINLDSIIGVKGFHGKFNMGLLNTYIAINGATDDGKFNYNFGIRRIHYDFIAYLIDYINKNTITNYSQMIPEGRIFQSYYDSHGKLEYKDKYNNLKILWLFTYQPMYEPASTITEFKIINFIGGINHKLEFNEYLSWENSFQYGIRNDYYSSLLTNDSGDLSPNLLLRGLRDMNEKNSILKSKISFLIQENIFYLGVEIDNYYEIGINEFKVSTSSEKIIKTNIISDLKIPLNIYSVFFGYKSSYFDRKLNNELGLRVNYIDYINKYTIEPRFTIIYKIINDMDIYTSLGYSSQFITYPLIYARLDEERTNMNVPAVWNYAIGLNSIIYNSYSLNFELFYKDYDNPITTKLLDVGTINIYTHGSDKRVYGYEITIMKKSDDHPFYGWFTLGGFWTWKFREFELGNPTIEYYLSPEEKALSESYPLVLYKYYSGYYATPSVNEWYLYDSQNYKLNTTIIWEITKEFNLTGEFIWINGRSYTPIVGVTNNIPIYGKYNSSKFPDFHTLNLKLEWRFNLFDLPSCFYLQINNVYNNSPVVLLYFDEYGNITYEQKLFGIYPILGFWIKW